MSAAAVRRAYAGPSSSTQTQTQVVNHSQHPPYPTPISSNGTAAGVSRNGSGVSMHRYAGYPPPQASTSNKVAGDSWSLQHEGDRQVIVIEDTPPPTATTSAAHPPPPGLPQPKKQRYNNGTYSQQHPRSSYSAPAQPAQPSYHVNQVQLATTNYALPPPAPPALASTSQIVAPPRKVQAKRKYGEVVDPAAAVRLPPFLILARSTEEFFRFRRMAAVMRQSSLYSTMTRTATTSFDRTMSLARHADVSPP